MKTYQILILIISLLAGQQLVAQDEPVELIEATFTEVPFYKCMNCVVNPSTVNGNSWVNPQGEDVNDNPINIGLEDNDPMGCNTRVFNFSDEVTNDKRLYIRYRTDGAITTSHQDFPNGTNAITFPISDDETQNTLYIDLYHPGTKEGGNDDLTLYVGRVADGGNTHDDYTKSTLLDIDDYNNEGYHLGGLGSGSLHKFQFTKAGLYFIYASVNFNGDLRIAEVTGWVIVRPKKQNHETFAACYVGPDGVCPDEHCDCVNTIANDGTSDSHFYGASSGLYQAAVKMNTLKDELDDPRYDLNNFYSFYEEEDWFYNSTTTYDTDENNALATLHNDATVKATGSSINNEIPYRIESNSAIQQLQQYHEYIYYQYVEDGIKSDVHRLKIERNLRPLPLYTYRLDCFGHEIKLINQTQFFGSVPYYVKYTWHLGNGERIEMPEHQITSEDWDNGIRDNDWQNLESYDYTNPGDFVPVLEIQYSYDEVEKLGTDQEVCGIRTVYSKEADIETNFLENEPLEQYEDGASKLIVGNEGIIEYKKQISSLPISVRPIGVETDEPSYKTYETS